LKVFPHYDDVRILLGRALLGLGRTEDAAREFRMVLDEPLPSARNLVWANEGLAEVAAKSGQNAEAIRLAESVIRSDADYGASYAARKLRNRLGGTTPIDPSIKAFFAEFDRAATSNRKADVEALFLGGEATRFAAGVAGSTEKWQTRVTQVDAIGPEDFLVEVELVEKLLNKDEERGTAVYRLRRMGGAWKLAGVEIFEVA
jgi:tetratricopeptide (TPR) repeat protein